MKILFLFLLFTTTVFYSQENNFVINDKKVTITLALENNAKAIELEKETNFTVTTIGMDIKKTSIVGSGIKISNSENALGKNHIQCTTIVTEKAIVDGHYTIRIWYHKNNKNKTYTFLIPVKKK